MLYFGVHFACWHLKITALSQGFAVIDAVAFPFVPAGQLRAWANALKNSPTEPAQWFIDENDFYQPDYPTEIFQFQDPTNTVFLVNHRALCELMQFSQELTAAVKNASALPPADFFLASAIRLFHANHCKRLTPAARPW
jgi:hypothetical protein